MNKIKHILHIFRRDIRLQDNTSLNFALKNVKKVSLVFIFNPKQTNSEKNPYFGANAFQYLAESLLELEQEVKNNHKGCLNIFIGDTTQVLDHIKQQNTFDAITFNKDYTPFAKKRDENIKNWGKTNNVQIFSFHDALLHPPNTVKTKTNGIYKVFTPFYKASLPLTVNKPYTEAFSSFNSLKNSITAEEYFKKHPLQKNPNIIMHGGRKNALKNLNNIKNHALYAKNRDFPAQNSTTILSPAHKFGTISIRETYHEVKKHFGKEHTLINELFWRDFYTHIAFSFPHVFGKAFKLKYDGLLWRKSDEDLEKWKNGMTGFPIVDAGMRELKHTGFMHNRVRMITASFLTKTLRINWQEGEKHFANYLTDYDPAVNNGGWQWAASTGTDAQPYFRIFNPWRQQSRFDPEAKYVKKWIPELQEISPKEIHNWKGSLYTTYPVPMVNHAEQAKKTKSWFKMHL